jgi:hypothetical protein
MVASYCIHYVCKNEVMLKGFLMKIYSFYKLKLSYMNTIL